MANLLRTVILAAPLLVAACASVPAQRVELSGTLPPTGTFALVQPDPALAEASAPAASAALACLTAAGLAARQPAPLLAQLGHAVRPARAQVLPGGMAPPQGGPRGSARRDQEELSLTLTDRVSGGVLWRGAVIRQLRKGEVGGDGTALVAPLCDALRTGRAAG